ncbi:E3 ubiquitin-protein ligase UHRF1 isoform X1 [Nasonia vitripennis]|uniref:RING-type E3 ubiquitin transferase n=2 Tax=Nasonia vitripennis TaxID=7425 RepID=A0A7M7QIE5_NASVI|nr:E3 ubiquitin-protein ligase UHRF1 isoform X1 [Nasonia vitripennis]
MYIKIRNCNNFEELEISIVKSATIAKLKKEIEKQLAINSELQRLYFSGKHLEDENTLYDYNIRKNDVIQFMVKSDKMVTENLESPKVDKNKNDVNYEEKKEKEMEIVEDAVSDCYAVGDAVDCVDLKYGAWFEATITRICYKNKKLVYFVKWDLVDYAQPFQVDEDSIRPRACRIIPENDLVVGQKVMINHNLDDASQVGHWYDFEIKRISAAKKNRAFFGTLFLGNNAQSQIYRTVIFNSEVYAIEKPKPLKDRNENDSNFISNIRRIVAPECSKCFDKLDVKCKECGCKVCGGKDNPDQIILCDECEDEYHIGCLTPALPKVPEEDWYCPRCKTDDTEIIKMGEKIKKRQKKNGYKKSYKIMYVKKEKRYPTVRKDHRGPIPGIEVGTTWWNRVKLAEDRVHMPPIAGIHGRESDCAYSIILSGGYGDIDNGIEFIYTGSGGRDVLGNKQNSHQTLTRANKALALNCRAKFNDQEGAVATDWRAGIPVRVVRSYKLSKYSKYAPSEGNRYDGLYKVVKYYPEYDEDGFRLWRYLLRRDDPLPPPWTPEGKRRIAELGLKMRYPDGYEKKNLEKKIEKPEKKLSIRNNANEVKDTQPKKKQKVEPYHLDSNVSELIDKDVVNAKLWQACKSYLASGKACFQNQVSKSLQCVCCHDLVFKPVTTPCAHNICQSCLKKSFVAGVNCCPTCRFKLKKNLKLPINKDLAMILILLFPGYERGRK